MGNVLRVSEAASLALHTAVLLAGRPGEDVSTKSIASRLRVSQAHLSKVLQRLVKAGLVNSIRGPKGGFCLSRSAKDIALLEVYESIEGPIDSAKCLATTPVCRGEECVLGGLVESVNREVKEYFARTKLSELTGVF